MFWERRRDRRRGYSFHGHFNRVRQQKGVGRIALSVCGTVLVAGAFLANCRSESVTGPVTNTQASGGDVSSGGSRPSGLSHSVSDLNGKTVTTSYEAMDSNPCNDGEAIPVKGRTSVTIFASSLDVTHMKFQIHLVADGTGSLGNVYHGDDEFLDESNVSILPFEETTQHNVSMHSNTAPDYQSKLSFHITISGNGELTAFTDKPPNDPCSK